MTMIISLILILTYLLTKTFYCIEVNNIEIKKVYRYLLPKRSKEDLIIICGSVIVAATSCFILVVQGKVNVEFIEITAVLILSLIAACVDVKQKRIPNSLIIFGLAFRLISWGILFAIYFTDFIPMFINDFLGILFGVGIFFIARIVSKDSIGMGDIKLVFVISTLVGLTLILGILFYSMVSLAIIAIVGLLTKKVTRKSTLPMAPFVFLGSILCFIISYL